MSHMRQWLFLPKRGMHHMRGAPLHSKSTGDHTTYQHVKPGAKHSIKRLEDNLKWLNNARHVKQYVAKEGNISLCNKLDVLAHMEKCPVNAPNEKAVLYIARTVSVLGQLLPLISETDVDFRQNYVMGTPFIQYVITLMGNYHHLLSKDMLINSLEFLSSLSSPALCDLMKDLLKTLRQMPHTLGICLDHCRNLLLLLHNTGCGPISYDIHALATEVIFDSIVAGIDIKQISTSLSILHVLRQQSPDDAHLGELTALYLNEVKNDIFGLDSATLLNILQFIYRCAYTDDVLYTTTMESLLYKYELLTLDEKSTLVLLLPFLKHMCLMRTPNISTNIYSEECQMLNAMLRREFENIIMQMQFDDMVTHCLALSLMFKQSGVIRKLLLRSIDSNFVESMDGQGFLKLLSCCNTLHITSSCIEVSRLLSKSAHKLLDCNGPDALFGFKSLSQITARRHRKYLVPFVENVLLKNKDDCASIIECLHVYASLNMQRINSQVLKSGFDLLFPHLINRIDAPKDTSVVDILKTHSPGCVGRALDAFPKGIPNDTTCMVIQPSTATTHISTGSPEGERIVRLENGSTVLYIPASETIAHAIPLRGLCKLLECLTKLELGLESLVPLFSLLQTSILAKVKYNSSVKFSEISVVLKCLTESRIVYADLADTILDRVYHCPELLEDPASASIILQFIEFTNHKDYSSKLSKPLFEFCLRKPTAELMEVLEYQRYKRPEFYASYMDLLRPSPLEIPDGFGGVVKHGALMSQDYGTLLSVRRLSRPPGGKRQHILSQWLSDQPEWQGFEEYYKIGNLILDLFHPKHRLAVLILRSQDCYGGFKSDNRLYFAVYRAKVHLKGRMWLICQILRLQGVRVLLIPEHAITNDNILENSLSQVIDV
ncbi:hypothetical protein X943_002664 [Babesia divergens]|uniref:RAP domain-containing protein n=1 Tax=Babesia divergens TaxID=32595 RepID=A0AAD9LE81_BABDI|nr:hypothetical protein X943_002664 [Babesia divergens]